MSRAKPSPRKRKRAKFSTNDVVDWQPSPEKESTGDTRGVFDFGKADAAKIHKAGAPARVFAQAFQDLYPRAFDQATTFEDAFALAYSEALKEACSWLHLR